VRNLKLFISLGTKISPFGRNDNNGDYAEVSGRMGRYYLGYPLETVSQ